MEDLGVFFGRIQQLPLSEIHGPMLHVGHHTKMGSSGASGQLSHREVSASRLAYSWMGTPGMPCLYLEKIKKSVGNFCTQSPKLCLLSWI